MHPEKHQDWDKAVVRAAGKCFGASRPACRAHVLPHRHPPRPPVGRRGLPGQRGKAEEIGFYETALPSCEVTIPQGLQDRKLGRATEPQEQRER